MCNLSICKEKNCKSYTTYFKNNNNGEIDSISISRDDLAALSGTASETVSCTLTEFKNEGLIEKKGSLLKILNYDKISKMIN